MISYASGRAYHLVPQNMARQEFSYDELLRKKPPIAELCENIRTNKWFMLGIQLELSIDSLKQIREEFGEIPERRAEMFDLWLRTKPETATRQKLLQALKLKAVEEIDMASNYERFIRSIALRSSCEGTCHGPYF